MTEDKNTIPNKFEDSTGQAQSTPAPTPPPAEPADAEAVADKPIIEVEEVEPETKVAEIPEKIKEEVEPIVKTEEPIVEPLDSSVASLSQNDPVATGQAKTKVVSVPEISPIVQPILSFLDKLKELRGRANKVRHENMEENLKKVVEYAREKQKIINDDVERLTGVEHRQAVNYLNILVKNKKLMKFGSKSTTFYKPIKQ